jgi:hypothetical protein
MKLLKLTDPKGAKPKPIPKKKEKKNILKITEF